MFILSSPSPQPGALSGKSVRLASRPGGPQRPPKGPGLPLTSSLNPGTASARSDSSDCWPAPGRGATREELPPEALAFRYAVRSEEHTSELQSRLHLVCRLLLEKKKKKKTTMKPVIICN